MRLLIRCEASARLGAGHAMRCMALAERADDAVFLMQDGADLARSRGFEVRALEGASAGVVASAWRPDWVVVDLEAAEPLVRELAAIAPVLRLDDGGFADETGAQLVLNPNVGITPAAYPRVPRECLMLGPQYSLLRKAFVDRLQQSHSQRTAERPCVFVGFGGSDPPNLTERVVRALAEESQLRLRVVIGAQNPHREVVMRAAARHENVELFVDPQNLADLIVTSDLAVTTASGMLWEFMALEIPVIAYAIADNQRGNLAWLEANSVGATLGWHAEFDPAKLVNSVTAAISDADWRSANAARGHALVDGRGVERALSRMSALAHVGAAG